ncbi:Hypothetical_protein [Hexamita inflata]|uniref:Hypothetical_protein n=1 Tax=Hexamita inflata TaxID=28002 RepID=A0AA86PKK4_9EUKA|nr:Hypothetical protein HINF_LOCUS24579 [Hexamita inflata]
MDAEIMQQSTIVTTINNDNNFALFGFNNNVQQIQQSVINITVGFNLYNGALICFQCDVSIANSVTVFIASGQYLSGLVFNSVQTIQLQNTSIQYRFTSSYSAGLIFNLSQQISTFDLTTVNILGYNTISTNQAQFILVLNLQQSVNITQVQICQEMAMFATESQFISFSTPVQQYCKSICASNTYYVYGICAGQPINSDYVITNETFVCIKNAVFDGNQCICTEGHVLNGSVCVNVSQSLTNIYQRIESLSNVEADMNTVFQLINNLNQSVETELAQLQQDIAVMYTEAESHLINNISTLNSNLNNNSNELDKRIFNNISQLQQELLNSNISLQQQINSSTQSLSNSISTTNNALNISTTTLNKSVSDLNQSLIQSINQINSSMLNIQNMLQSNIISNFTTLDQRLASNITQKDLQIQQLTDSLAFVTSIVMNTVEQELWFECQQQLYTFKVFDLASVTNSIQSSDFASGFAFDTQVIQNAFLDVQSISSSFTLFKTQSVFLNIKVQLNDISFVSGTMLSPSSSIQINQLAVVSKVGTQVTINAGVVLSILQQTATVTNITNLLLNINMNPSSAGIISLINVVNGQLIVKGYQILGSYSSTNTIALCIKTVKAQSTVLFSYISIIPYVFNCGNLSSYLIQYVSTSSINIQKVSIQVGDILEYNIISNITTSQTNYFLFGGLIAYINTSQINIIEVTSQIFDCYNISFSGNTGQILGYTNTSTTQFYSICVNNQISANQDTQFTVFGIIGLHTGSLSINQLSAIYVMEQGVFNYVGVLGNVKGDSANLLNTEIQMQMSSNFGAYVAALCGVLWCSKISIVNTTIQDSFIEAKNKAGLISATTNAIYLFQIRVNSSYVNTICNISEGELTAFAGGLIGDTWGLAQIQQCIVTNHTSISYSANTWAISAGLIGDIHQFDTIIQQSTVDSSYIKSTGSVKNIISAGGILGYIYDASSVQVSTTSLTNSILYGAGTADGTYVGGIFAYYRNSSFAILDSSVKNVRIYVQGSVRQLGGLIICYSGANVYMATNIKTEGDNFINDVSIANCPNAINQTPSGC